MSLKFCKFLKGVQVFLEKDYNVIT